MKQPKAFLLTVCILALLFLATPVSAQGTIPAYHADVFDFVLMAMGLGAVGTIGVILMARSNRNQDEDE